MRAYEFLEEPFQGLDLEMEFDEDEIWVTARDASGRELGHVLFVDTGDELVPQDLEVEERFRGQGIARVMYDWVKSKGYRIRRSNSQTRAGAEFWNKYKPGKNVWEQDVAEGIDPDTFEELDPRIIARAAKQIVPTIRAKNTPEGYVHVTTEDGLDLYIGAGVADGVISVYIGSGGGVTTSGARKGAVTEIIRSVYHAAVRKYGEPDTPGELTIDHDAGHGVWQHIADKLGLTYAAVKVKESGIRPDDVSENFADGKKPGRKGLSKRVGIPKKTSLTQLAKIASSSSGERRRMAQWQLNMRRGKAKANK